jgi:hypothetical protein
MHIQHFLPNVEVRERVGGRVLVFDSPGSRGLECDGSAGAPSGPWKSMVWPEVQGCEYAFWEDQ